MIVDLPRHLPAFGGRRDDERAPVGGAHRPRDEAAVHEPVEDAREGRTLVGETAMQVGDGRGRLRRELREDVRFALRQSELAEVSEIQPDPMRRAVNVRNQPEWH